MTWTKVILAVALLAASASSSPLLYDKLGHFGSDSRVDGDYRLPNNTVPISYVISLTPYILVDNFTFDGGIQILLEVLESTSNITLHTDQLTYSETLTTLVSAAGVSQNVTSHTYVESEQFLIIGVQNILPVGNYTLNLTFTGILSDDMAGFYRSSYTSSTGDTVWLATTQFEPTSARRAFPCYDEPALKATFDVRIKHAPEYHALSNMPITQSYTDTTDGYVWTLFEVTPLMSTYLLAFVVSDFSAIKNSDESYNVWSRPNKINETQYAFDIGSVELAELEDFTNITYTLPKMDQIAIPDFSAGAMENWGLVTYRETSFFYNESTSTTSTKQGIATVISHEFAHQWFGNLVSPLWWKYLWLNEGFATYFQYLTTDAAEDNWRLMDQFVVVAQQALAFATDSSPTSHPLNQDVSSPSEISAIFDNISYRKGASIIRMMSHFLTEDVFKAGLTKYLNAKAYGAASSDDLFEALQEAETEGYILPYHVYVKDIMDTWVEQMGYPVVTVTRNYTTATTEISQERFLIGEASSTDDHDYKWWIPLNWVSQASPDFSATVAQDWIRSQDESVMLSGLNAAGWVIFNKQQTGYYRVNYDDTNWGMIANYLNSDDYENIHVLNRAALIDDALNLARADRLSYSIVFDVTLYLQQELDYVPWYATFNGLSFLNRVFANTNEWESYRRYFAFLTTNLFASVGIEESSSDDHLTLLNRANAINYACNYGLETCRASAEAKLVAWLDDSTANPISPTLRTNTICAGLRGANATTWTRAFTRYQTTELTTEQTALLAGLGCSENATIIKDWLDTLTSNTSGLTTTQASSAFVSVYQGSAYNVDRAFDYIINNWDRITSYFTNSSIQTFVSGIAYRLTTEAQLTKLNTLVTAQSAILGTTATTAIGYAESNIAWTATYEAEISEWLVSTLAELDSESTTVESEVTTVPNDVTTVQYETTTSPSEGTTLEDVETTTESSSAAASLSMFVAMLVFTSLIHLN